LGFTGLGNWYKRCVLCSDLPTVSTENQLMNTSSIEITRDKTIKQSIKEWLGRTVANLSAKRAQELFDAPVSQPVGFRDKAIMAHLKRMAIIENEEDFFERLHFDFWKGEGGAVFSENCDHRFEDLFLAKQVADFDILQQVWAERKPEHIVEFGCNSGLLLNYLTKNLPGVISSTGIEINADQVKRNQQSSSFDGRIAFECADGGKWLLENGKPNTLFVSNGGVLEYFRRERLDQMLTHIRTTLGRTIFFTSEPFANDHDWSKTAESIPFGEELSFSHNYSDLFESNGFEILHQQAVEYDSWKMMATIAKIG